LKLHEVQRPLASVFDVVGSDFQLVGHAAQKIIYVFVMSALPPLEDAHFQA
jgi:hypothetical protein